MTKDTDSGNAGHTGDMATPKPTRPRISTPKSAGTHNQIRLGGSGLSVDSPNAVVKSTGVIAGMLAGARCGAEGGSSTSDNVGPLNLINKRLVAYPLKTTAEVRASMPPCPDGICESGIDETARFDNVDVNAVVAEILKRLRA